MFEKLKKDLLCLDNNHSISCCIETKKEDFVFRGMMTSCEIEFPSDSKIIISSGNGNMMIIDGIDDDKVSYDFAEEEYIIEYLGGNVYISLWM